VKKHLIAVASGIDQGVTATETGGLVSTNLASLQLSANKIQTQRNYPEDKESALAGTFINDQSETLIEQSYHLLPASAKWVEMEPGVETWNWND
jgi:hypothetical protein